MNKSGITFLLASVIIVSIIVGLAVVSNEVIDRGDFKVEEDLYKEFKFEIAQTIDSAVFQGLRGEEVEEKIDEYIDLFKRSSLDKNVRWKIFFNQSNSFTDVYYQRSDFTEDIVIPNPKDTRLYYQLSSQKGQEVFVRNSWFRN